MSRSSASVLLFAAALAAPVAAMATADADLAEAKRLGQQLDARVGRRVLPNGLTVLVLPRRVSPTVSFQIYYRVGSVDEPRGQTGIAHMYEHMAFMGDRRVGVKDATKEAAALDRVDRAEASIWEEKDRGAKGDPKRIETLEKERASAIAAAEEQIVAEEFGQIYERHGGRGLNAFTAADQTAYIVSLPANRLELWAVMESSRMLDPVLRRFYRERDVVREERRIGENRPQGWLFEKLVTNAFDASPYGTHDTIGWMSDLERLSRPGTEAFFRKHYVPANVVVAIVGDVDAEKTLALAERYFGRLVAGPMPVSIRTKEYPQRGEKRLEVEFDSPPYLAMGFRRPSGSHADDAVYDVISSVLSQGRSSRFYKALVRDKKLASEVEAFAAYPGVRYDTLFGIYGVPQGAADTSALERGVQEELDRLSRDGATEKELQKVRNNAVASLLRTTRSNFGMAYQLSYYEGIFGDWREFARNLERTVSVTSADVKRVSAATFLRGNRTVVSTVRPPKAAK